MFCILMEFGTVVDLNVKTRLQKNFRKTPMIYEVIIIQKNAIFAHSVSLHMPKTSLNF